MKFRMKALGAAVAAAALCTLACTSAFASGGPSGANVRYAVQGHIGEVVWNPYKII